MGRFRIEECYNELGYLEKRVVLTPDTSEERQALTVFEVMYKWGSGLERSEVDEDELTVIAMVPMPGAAKGKSNET